MTRLRKPTPAYSEEEYVQYTENSIRWLEETSLTPSWGEDIYPTTVEIVEHPPPRVRESWECLPWT